MICLDTNAVVTMLRDRRSAIRGRFDAALQRGGTFAIPSIVLFELYYGAAKSTQRDSNLQRIAEFLLAPIEVLPFGWEDAQEAGEIRATLAMAGTPIGPYDVLIAAQTRRRDAVLVTANAREFARVPGLKHENWAVP
jgi:tRNA(fMet)-specific endonuclease VapC